MKKIQFLLIILFIVTLSLNAQQGVTISGVVSDLETNETIIGATVRIKDTYSGTVTNVNGFFQLRGVENGTHILEVAHIAYKTKEIKVTVTGKNLLLEETKLAPESISIDEVSVVELRPEKLGDREVETSVREISMKAVQLIPTARNDVFRALKFLPGIESSSPLSPLVSIRGGDPNENMVMIDGVVLYNPYHVSTSAGIFNTNTVKDIELLVGGFGAEYGGRNSSIINVTTKDGNSNGFHGEFQPTSNHFKGFCEFPVTANSTMTLAARAYYPIAGNFMTYANTYYYDMNLSYTFKLGKRNSMSIKYLTSRDVSKLNVGNFYKYFANSFADEDIKDAFNNLDLNNSNKWNNNAITLINRSILSPTLTLRTQVYGSFHNSDNSSGMRYRITDDETGDVYFNDNYSTNFESYIHDLTAKASLTWIPGVYQTIKIGGEASSYKFFNAAKINDFSKGEESVKPNLLAGFIEDKIKLGPVILRPGVRITKYSGNDDIGIEPRSNILLKLPWDMELKAAWGIYYQYLTSMNTAEYEFTQMLDYYYPFHNREPLKSTHYIVGFNKDIGKTSTLTFDVFYKDMERLYTFDLMAASDGESLGDKLLEGSGRSYGVEMMLMGKIKSFSGWLSYTLSRSEREFPGFVGGDTFLSEYDRTHALKGVVNYQLTDVVSYSLALQCMSGHPTTIARTQQVYYYYDPVSNSIIPSTQYVDDKKNNARLPFVIQMDMGLKKRIRSGFGVKLEKFLKADESFLTVDIVNLTFFYRNIEYYSVPGFEDMYFPVGFNYLPSVSFGYSIKF